MTSKEFQDELSILINTAMDDGVDYLSICGALALSMCAFGVGFVQQEVNSGQDSESE